MGPSLIEVVVAALLGGGLFQAIRALLALPSDRQLTVASAYSKLVGDLRQRIDDLEADLAEERDNCAEQIRGLQHRIARLERSTT